MDHPQEEGVHLGRCVRRKREPCRVEGVRLRVEGVWVRVEGVWLCVEGVWLRVED